MATACMACARHAPNKTMCASRQLSTRHCFVECCWHYRLYHQDRGYAALMSHAVMSDHPAHLPYLAFAAHYNFCHGSCYTCGWHDHISQKCPAQKLLSVLMAYIPFSIDAQGHHPVLLPGSWCIPVATIGVPCRQPITASIVNKIMRALAFTWHSACCTTATIAPRLPLPLAPACPYSHPSVCQQI
jgi:hypothetical protein